VSVIIISRASIWFENRVCLGLWFKN